MSLPLLTLHNQPEEIIIEQLRYLPLQDVLDTCRVNQRISQVCRGKRLWDLRLIDDFKVQDLSRISNPRSYYFSLLQERQNILDFILANITSDIFDTGADWFPEFDMNSYQDFVNIQRAAVGQLTEEEINAAKVVQKLLPRLTYVDFGPQINHQPTTFFYELYRGVYKINLTSTIPY